MGCLIMPQWFSLNATGLRLFGISMFLCTDKVIKHERRRNKKKKKGERRTIKRKKKKKMRDEARKILRLIGKEGENEE